ncbi:hypothetical protein BH10ACT10_BH10ACT10_10060 [soil metagenome]
MNTPLDSFESALLTRLREHVEEAPAVPPRPTRRRLLLGVAPVVAAVAVLVVVVPGLGAARAYSVQEGNSGTITVEVRRLEDAQGLEALLARSGVRADITYVPGGQQCAPGRYTPVERTLSGMGISMGTNLLRVTLPAGTIRDGERLVMAVSGVAVPAPTSEPSEEGVTDGAGFSGWADVSVTAGPVQPCRIVPGDVASPVG